MRKVWPLWVAVFTLVAGSAVLPAREAPAFGTGSFWHADQPLRQYRAFRRMHAYSESLKHEAWMDAWTELRNGRFDYHIVSERGSNMIRSRVLKSMLEREQEIVNSGDCDRGDLTPANYEFGEAERDTDGRRFVRIKPRRQDVLLVDGRAVLSDGGDLLRVEGRLVKNPSFWTSLVDIVRRYARVGGVRVPVATETVARLKFVGNAQLDVLYEYQSVNGRAVTVSEPRPAVLARSAAR